MQSTLSHRIPRHVRISLSLLPWCVAGLLFMLAATIEKRLFPVVTDFHVQRIDRFDNAIIISGIMRKDRSCAFAGVSAVGIAADGDSTELAVRFLDGDNHTSTRPPGTQAWGPWRILLPYAPEVSEIRLDAYHDCHWIWTTKTNLAKVPVLEGP